MNLRYIVEGEEQGYIKTFDTKEDAKAFFKDLKESDKRMGINDKYIIIPEKY